MLGQKLANRFTLAAILCGGSVTAWSKEPAGDFFDPSGALAPSARVSAGVAEKYTKGYLLHKSAPTEDSKPNTPTNHATPHTAHHHDQDATSDQSNTTTEPTNEDEVEGEALERTTLLPTDWHQIHGIQWEVLYTGEAFNNMRGGINTKDATRYRGNLDIVFTYDTEANELWDGGQFFVYGSNTHGKTLTPDFVGDFQFYSNIDSDPRPNLMQVSEYWYLHRCVDGIFSVKAGKCDANADFAYMELASDFIHASYSLSTNIYLPTWPNQALGAVAFWEPREKLAFAFGVYDGAGDGRLWGFSTLGDNGTFLIGQAKWTPQFGKNQDLPGTYRIGVWKHTGEFDFVTNFATEFVCTNGVYGTCEQLIYKERDADEQGLGIFSQISHANSESQFSTLNLHWSIGAIYRGWFEGRDADTWGAGLTSLSFDSIPFTDPDTEEEFDIDYQPETAIEVFYKYQWNAWTTLQPDLQFICNPGGDGSIQDAFLFGLRFQTSL